MQLHRFASGVGVLFLGLLAQAGPARAEPSICTLTGMAGSVPMVDCTPQECADASSCSERFENAVCDSILPGVEQPLCRPSCGTLFRCDTTEDCPRLLNQVPECQKVEFEPTGARAGICAYRGIGLDYCAGGGGVTAEHVFDCQRTPLGLPTSDWRAGDCDADGCPNGRDPEPCEDTEIQRCGSVTVGDGACVPQIPNRDAGVADAGAIDGGTGTEGDAGATDAGAIDGDAGATDGDAGAIDAGAADGFDAGAKDGGPVAPPGTQFEGGGGCHCAIPGAPDSNPRGGIVLALLGALALLLRRR